MAFDSFKGCVHSNTNENPKILLCNQIKFYRNVHALGTQEEPLLTKA